jgi:hypothetical protein
LPTTANSKLSSAPLPKKASGSGCQEEKNNRSTLNAFLNVSYDKAFESLFLAYIAGLCGFGLIPRATLEIPGGSRRLDRTFKLIGECQYSFHDLSRVELDNKRPPTPRFNMPFELGLVVAWAKTNRKRHDWFVFETQNRRLNKSLSDLDGTDPYIHRGSPTNVLRCLANALVRNRRQPTVTQLTKSFSDLKSASVAIKSDLKTRTLFEARPFKELVVAATRSADNRIP